MYWANFLHIYQPPTQTEEIVRKVADECYRNLVSILEKCEKGKLTLNISGILTEQLAKYGYSDIIDGLGRLAERGQIEFTGSAMYHPILPLIPEDEIRRQIELNNNTNRRFFGDVYNPAGFFPPEMCYSFDVAKIVSEFGFSWIIVDEIAYRGSVGMVDDSTIYKIRGLKDFSVYFKERPFSAGLTYGAYPDKASFLQALNNRMEKHCYLLTGTDGEIYGHHRPGQENLLIEIFDEGIPPTCTISELNSLFPHHDDTLPLNSSWSTWEDEMRNGIPYPQWSYPGHDIHILQWKLTNAVLSLVQKMPENAPMYRQARKMVDEGLHSCQYWWASCRPWWDTGMIEAGARRLYDAFQLLQDYVEPNIRSDITVLFNKILSTAAEWQQNGKAKLLKEQYMKEHPMVGSELTFGNEKRTA